MRFLTAISILLLLLLPLASSAVVIRVPDDQPTIQAGIEAASAGDIVLVACGAYAESEVVLENGVVVRCEAGETEEDRWEPDGNPSSAETTVGEETLPGVQQPSPLELLGARPHPFSSTTEIVFRLPQVMHVSVRIYDVTGRIVRTLVSEMMSAGEHRVGWDRTAEDGQRVVAGIYFYSFRADDHSAMQKLIVSQ